MPDQLPPAPLAPPGSDGPDWDAILRDGELGAVGDFLREMPVFLTPKQAAARVPVSVGLVYQWCQAGGLPHLRVGRVGRKGKILIEAGDLDKFLASFKVTHAVTPLPASARPKSAFRHLRVS